MLVVIIDYLMQIFNPLGKITMFWAKIFSTNTSINQTVLKNIEYCVFVAHVRTNVEAYNLYM